MSSCMKPCLAECGQQPRSRSIGRVLAVRASQSNPGLGYELRTPPEFVRLVAPKKIPRFIIIVVAVAKRFKQECPAEAQAFVFRIKRTQITEDRFLIRKRDDDRNNSALETKGENSKHIP